MDSVKILIIDDEPDITLTLRKGRERSYRIDSYNDPIEALSDFKAIAVGHSNAQNYIAMTRKELHKNLVRYYSKITNSITTAPNIAERTRS